MSAWEHGAWEEAGKDTEDAYASITIRVRCLFAVPFSLPSERLSPGSLICA